MIPNSLTPVVNHIIQSTLCVFAAWVLTLALRRNRASVRYWIWLAASVKFLVAFSLLVSVGAVIPWRIAEPTLRKSNISFGNLEATTGLPVSGVAAPSQTAISSIVPQLLFA